MLTAICISVFTFVLSFTSGSAQDHSGQCQAGGSPCTGETSYKGPPTAMLSNMQLDLTAVKFRESVRDIPP